MKLFGPRKLPSRLAWLARISVFSHLSPVELRIVEGLLHQREYLEGEIVFDEGEEGQALYMVREGEIILCRQGEPESGRIAVLGPDTFFGDMALLDNLPRSAQARAGKPTHLAVFFREDFLGLMDTHARIASKISLQLAREMGRRLRWQSSSGEGAWQQHQ
jgi:CRP-like cAMP-binding protein